MGKTWGKMNEELKYIYVNVLVKKAEIKLIRRSALSLTFEMKIFDDLHPTGVYECITTPIK